MKYEGREEEERVRLAATPGEAKKLGRSFQLRPNWDDERDEVMFEACLAKFTQHEDLKKRILGTGDAFLVEHTRNDRYWGDGGDGSGQNKLGKILMRVRETIREKEGK